MASDRVEALTHADIVRTASGFTWTRQMPKWTVIVDKRELPARPLVLDAAGVPPNDPTNSHQAIKKLKSLGFDIRYEGKSVENGDKAWEKQINGRTWTFTKTREKEGVFLYGCEHRGKDTLVRTGFHSDRDLKPEEVECLPQFKDFLEGKV